MYLDGQFVETESSFATINPATGDAVAAYQEASIENVEDAVASARSAFLDGRWSDLSGGERMEILLRVSTLIRENAEELALLETAESGKPISQSRDEMGWTCGLWDYAATLCRHVYGDSHNHLGKDKMAFVMREPIGVVGMITPWNFPILIISQKLPFALAAGCTAVVKPSELTPGTTNRLMSILSEAGVPDGVVNLVNGKGEVGAALSAHRHIDMLSFTGSTNVGKLIVKASHGNLKKVSLELGGKNPQIVFADADMQGAVEATVFGIYFNMGECCNSGSRILVQEDFADEFVERVVELSKTIKVGDPMDPETKIGSIISEGHFEKVMGFLESGKEAGAELKLGGGVIESDKGRYIESTVFDRVSPDMEIASEEIFGPVLSIIRFKTEEEALSIANGTLYGLSASVWTKNVDVAFRMSRAIRAGSVWINCFMDGHPELPFGGYGESGLGRELGRFTIDEFTELKTIQLNLGDKSNWWING